MTSRHIGQRHGIDHKKTLYGAKAKLRGAGNQRLFRADDSVRFCVGPDEVNADLLRTQAGDEIKVDHGTTP